MGIPLPPGAKPSSTNNRASEPVHTKRDTTDEISYILDQTLSETHRLDPNILRFIARYVECWDPVQAAKEAGLDARSGRNLLSRPDIYAAVKAISDRHVMKYGYNEQEVVERVKEIAMLDPLDFYRADGSFRDLHEMSPAARKAIKKFKRKEWKEPNEFGVSVVKGEIVEIELWDKLKTLELLGREKSLFKETKVVKHDVAENMHALLLGAAERADKRIEGLREAKALPAPAEEMKDVGDGQSDSSGV